MQNFNVLSSEKSATQLCLKQHPVDWTLTQITICVIRLWLNSYPLFLRPTQLWLDSFESESSQIWLTAHESSTTLPSRPASASMQTGRLSRRGVSAGARRPARWCAGAICGSAGPAGPLWLARSCRWRRRWPCPAPFAAVGGCGASRHPVSLSCRETTELGCRWPSVVLSERYYLSSVLIFWFSETIKKLFIIEKCSPDVAYGFPLSWIHSLICWKTFI